ncbi:MAG TPA: bifunctional hydroxymethylpyrimidine kinase/phosphomethylpyrimidine kinase [Solirubrobacterales bacterium]|nr:bifunctional hydroxymethylpyrimidine kinase/phosphomethylpyrimidine kinase [Solirubrobacterales bacterium]HNH85858.1 bifunctional hydroxymethylpyrimidine kinase/phosphomethylpyrimidine kinase [Solirubrobacterales bacterium]HNI38895.1 bifunctional hydroxymethylpyrimidine kinase/phosphomethylpyrimidine kinase [Solirubrobacterales bacterium]HNK65141.1 bifunctional hydroxymethylpyrimidine kinase/phosphomethylpyrimidine kinase [Solirubrobacterales bacterium]
MSEERQIPAVLSIAGSDSGGGAGIQADLKAFAACGVHGMTAITAITAQNTVGVDLIEAISPEMIIAQIKAVAGDIGVDAVKIGMLGDRPTIEAVASGLDLLGDVPVVLDPVMVSESGANLLAVEAREALVTRILPRATVTTPNIPEARAITGLAEAGQPELAEVIVGLGVKAAVVTGGHSDEYVDFFFDGERGVEITGEVYPGRSAHGSGCTHSSALAAGLALGLGPLEAARKARELASRAVAGSLDGIGSGPGPVNALGL